MICANILIYYLLVTCCCCSGLKFVSVTAAAAAASSSSAPASSSDNQHEAIKQQELYLSPAAAAAAAAANENGNGNENNENNHQYDQKEAANHHVHKLMSEKDLRRTFQVDSHDQVPEYEVLKLQVNQDGSHLISPISDLGELLAQQSSSLLFEKQDDDRAATAAIGRHKREAPETSNDRTSSSSNSENNNNKLIVIDLSTFGKDFKLRLKRNADFQQRIKDMKMFMAESTLDGQLKYTEVSHPLNGQGGKHKQEPHKRAANADDESATGEEAATASATASGDSGDKKQAKESKQQTGGWNIGSTYHDEDNLAALLIDHDKKTGQLQIEGTIGNDFVIKPMPKATIETLLLARRQQQASFAQQEKNNNKQAEQQLATAESNSTTSRLDNPSLAAASNNTSGTGVGQQQQHQRATSSGSGAGYLDRAIHMHDDDPHDDDEMFLDEDEAIELAQLQQTNRTQSMLIGGGGSREPNYSYSAGNQTTSTNLPLHHHHANGSSVRILSKAASERKWNKYRKLLLAQPQVPKIQQMSEQSSFRSSASSGTQRARRHAQANDDSHLISHHIVFRQKPSSDGSSDEHQHSFMISPGSSMERLASSFQPKGDKRATPSEEPAGSSRLMMLDRDDMADADLEHDPLGGQFYLEPASVTGFERAGHSDWSFRAPYSAAFNHTSATSGNGTSSSSAASHAPKRRFKRHTANSRPPMILARGSSQVRRKRQAPDTVWPEVLLVVDYDSFLLHGSDSRDVKRYFVSFWNGVDLRYKLLVHPHIRISLAGMIVAKDRDATPYLERNRLRAPNADAVDAAGALTDMGKYLYREDRLPTYDLAVVITKLDMCRRRFEGGRCNRGTAGFAYVGGACVVNKRLEKVNSVAIIEDSGGFSGIIVAAHEVGHLLGCVHDGSPPPSYLGGPGATHCPWEDGFIMSDLRHTERGFRWSQCSVEQFKHFLNGETATCLYNYPHESQMLQRLLPGTMLSLDEQCKRDRGTNACFKDARVCAQLFCFDSASGYCVSYRPAAEGSPCGEGQVCRNGKCVGDIENIIPDYTHQSQTVVARGRPASAVAPAHGLARLADNGLSASSTSTATSSPDSKSAVGDGAAQPAAISSRMDTYPVDSPLIGVSPPQQQHYSGASYSSQFGGRQLGGESMTSSPAGVVMSRQRHPAGHTVGTTTTTTTRAAARSGKLIGTEQSTRKRASDQYRQRSGVVQTPPGSVLVSNQKSKGLQINQKSNSKLAAASAGPDGGPGTSASNLSRSQHQSSQTTPDTSSSSSSNINNNNNNNLLANSHNQLNHHHYQPSTSSIKAANSKQRYAATYHNTTPRHSTPPHTIDGGGHVNSNSNDNDNSRKQQFTNVNQHHHQQQAQYEPHRSTRAIYGSPALHLTSSSSQYHPMSMPASAAE